MKYSLFLFLILVISGITGRTLHAQVLVYELSFECSTETPDFEFYDGGWIVVDLSSQHASFVFTTSGSKRFIVSKNTGEHFFSSSKGNYHSNVRANSKEHSSQSQYLLTGLIDSTTKVKESAMAATKTMAMAASLSGYLLASESDTYAKSPEDEEDSLNLVGMLKISGSFDQTTSEYYNLQATETDQVIDDMIVDLVKAGFHPE